MKADHILIMWISVWVKNTIKNEIKKVMKNNVCKIFDLWTEKLVPWHPVFNDTHREKLCFIQFSTRMAASLFHMFTESVKFYAFYYYVLKGTDVLKMWFIK